MRDKSVDALRGLAIALVVAGHALFLAAYQLHGGPGMEAVSAYWVPVAVAANPLASVITSFHMPLFAFVSGLVMWPPRDLPLSAQVWRRFKGLMVPFFAWFLLLYFAAVLIPATTIGGPGTFLSGLLAAALGQGGLWFLYALFISVVAVLCLSRVPGSLWLMLASVVAAVVWSSGLIGSVPNVFELSYVLWIYPFVVLGYFLGPMRPQVLKHRWAILLVGLVAYLPMLYLRHPVFVPRLAPVGGLAVAIHRLGLPGGWTIAAALPYFCASAAVMALYALYVGRAGLAVDGQAWLGRRSLGIYATHTAFMLWFVSLGVHNALLLFALALGSAAATTAVLERIPVVSTILLGQRATHRVTTPLEVTSSDEAVASSD